MARHSDMEESEAVEALANYGFEIGEENYLAKAHGDTVIVVFTRSSGRGYRAPEKLTDPVELQVLDAVGNPFLFLEFDTVKDLIRSLGRKLPRSRR